MSIITEMKYMKDRNKYWIYIDDEYCTSLSKDVVELFKLKEGLSIDHNTLKNISGVSKIEYLDKKKQSEEYVRVFVRTVDTTRGTSKDSTIDTTKYITIRRRIFDTLKNRIGLNVGKIITYDKLLYADKFVWKVIYQGLWDEEKYRIDKVKQYIKKIDINDKIIIDTVGFGADTNEFIENHLSEQGKPDLGLKLRDSEEIFMYIEVTGTSKNLRNGDEYWIRPDKLRYYRNHLDEDIWVMLHYKKPKERIVIIKPDNTKEYTEEEEIINGAVERYVKFYDSDKEVKNSIYFEEYLKKYLK